MVAEGVGLEHLDRSLVARQFGDGQRLLGERVDRRSGISGLRSAETGDRSSPAFLAVPAHLLLATKVD